MTDGETDGNPPVTQSSGNNRESAAQKPSSPPLSPSVDAARFTHLETVEVAITAGERDFGPRFKECVKSADALISAASAAAHAAAEQEKERLTEELGVERRDHALTTQRQRADEKIIERLQLATEQAEADLAALKQEIPRLEDQTNNIDG